YTLNQRSDSAGADFTILNPPTEPTNAASPNKTVIYEAEDAPRSGPAIGTSNTGYTGSGYADYQANSGEYIEWTVTAQHVGAHMLSFRYANGGTANRPLSIRVNGVAVNNALAFPVTADWLAWTMTTPISVNLNKGVNTIRASSIGTSGGNIDHLSLSGPGVAPANAIMLFDGTLASRDANWKRGADNAVSNWPVANGSLSVNLSPSPNDIITTQQFKDFQLHVEWLSPSGGTGQEAGNSGIKLQRFYEIQVLNTPSTATLQNNDAGAIYLLRPASKNASLGAGNWQSYDIKFTAARWSGGTKIANARVTIRWNGILVHDDVEIPAQTGASLVEAPGLHPLMLQAHSTQASGPVQYRNVWIIPEDTFTQQWDAWLATHTLTGNNALPSADPDGDGINNRWEYAMGTNPKVSGLTTNGVSLRPEMRTVTVEDSQYIEFSYVRRIDSAARGLRYTVETSSTLAAGSWTIRTASEVSAPVPTGDGTTEICTIRTDTPVPAGTTTLFSRLGADLLE
ncbi:MAG: DUF1080 domain-containing protein, partial [Verrucomicrobiaceae bacterium]